MTAPDKSNPGASPLTITVTGGSGYIGRSLVDHLLAEGHKVRIVDIQDPHVSEGVEFHKIDLREPAGLSDAFSGSDAVIHLGGLVAGPADKDPDFARAVNEEGTAAVLEACSKAGVKDLVFASTFLVYTGADADTVDEETPIDAEKLKPFGLSKFRAEALVDEWGQREGNRFVTFRIGSVYGPGGGTNVIATFAEQALNGEELEIWGVGKRLRPLVYVGDVAAALDRSVRHLREGNPSGLFNCNAPVALSTKDILDGLEAAVPGVKVTYLEDKPEGAGDVAPSTAKVEKVLGWKAETEIGEGVRRTVDWFRAQRSAQTAAGGAEGE